VTTLATEPTLISGGGFGVGAVDGIAVSGVAIAVGVNVRPGDAVAIEA
jgi:hypothetical protein